VIQGVRMPALGQTSDELRIISWLKKEGDLVEKGEPLFEVETDKVTLEVEAYASGILKKIMHQVDEVVEVGTLVAYIGQADDVLPVEMTVQTTPMPAQLIHTPTPNLDIASSATSVSSASEKPLASPPVRALMHTHGIDPRQVKGSGPGGRIERRDIETLIQQISSTSDEELKRPEEGR
jgi:pyruvate/2-oxoglutarate dehydrogenase complex dihydrolipoamide acyltransferase (E2) component